ncbi:MAG: hypothetical protein H8E66_06130 [Planctomycetes bacterium]|nr:hypothetical protein [Planctomycetota bacterium]
MNLRSFAVVVAFVTPMSSTIGDESITKEKSSEARIATELDQHETNVRSLDRRFQEAIIRLEASYTAERELMHKKLSKTLKNEKKALTEKGELDQAIQIRDQVARIEATEIVPPYPKVTKTNGPGSTKPSNRGGILGTWRWNNGVDIRNLDDGKTNGNGTWQLVDPRENIYQFRWKRIPADRVKLSPNGRVLEGTKANDLSFRVWAVRID